MSSTPDPRDWDDEQIDALLARLEERVDTDTELGQAVKCRRRDVLKAIGAVGAGGLAGAAGMEAATGNASAGSQQAGTLGEPGNPIDAVAEDIYGPGGQGSGDAVAFEAVQTRRVNRDHYASEEGSLQAAIDAASAGHTVVFDADETISTRITPKSGVDIVGRNGATLTVADNAGLPWIIEYPETCSDVKISGFEIDGNGANGGSTGRAIGQDQATDIRDVTVEDVHAHGTESDCINFQTQSGGVLERIRVEDNRLDAAEHNSSSGHGAVILTKNSADTGKKWYLTGNNVEGWGAIGLSAFGNGTTEDVHISGNTVTQESGSANGGIILEGSIDNGNIVDNTVRNADIGLTGDGGRGFSITGNTVVGSSGNAIKVARSSGEDPDGLVVSDNTIRGISQNGIILNYGTKNASITGNTLINIGDVGIEVGMDNDSCTVSDNVLRDIAPGGSGCAIRVVSAATVTGNTCVNGGTNHIQIKSDDCTVGDNRLKDAGQTFAGTKSALAAGILLDGVVDCTVTGNRAFDSGINEQTYGVAGRNSSDYNVVVGNAFRGNQTGPTSGLGANTVVANNGT